MWYSRKVCRWKHVSTLQTCVVPAIHQVISQCSKWVCLRGEHGDRLPCRSSRKCNCPQTAVAFGMQSVLLRIFGPACWSCWWFFIYTIYKYILYTCMCNTLKTKYCIDWYIYIFNTLVYIYIYHKSLEIYTRIVLCLIVWQTHQFQHTAMPMKSWCTYDNLSWQTAFPQLLTVNCNLAEFGQFSIPIVCFFLLFEKWNI